jgi:hypothetical protein
MPWYRLLDQIQLIKEMYSEAARYLKMAKEPGWQELENQFKLNIARAAFKAKDYEAVIHQVKLESSHGSSCRFLEKIEL